MKAVGVIPARWGSTRFPGKALASLGGKPLIQWVWERASTCRHLDRLAVATDDQRIADAVRAFGGEVILTRPDHPSGTDRVAEAVAGLKAEIVVNIQGDEPFIEPRLVDRLVESLVDGTEWDMATAVCPIRTAEETASPNVVKVVRRADGGALYFSRCPIPFDRDGLGTVIRWRHIGLYAYRLGFLLRLVQEPPCALETAEKLEQLRALHIGGRILVIETEDPGFGVDTPEDLRRAEAMVRQEGGGGLGRRSP